MNSIGEKPRAGDRFGHAIATGNFNADAYDDAAIGVPFRKVDGAAGSGMVVVIYGGPDGLMSGPLSAVFTQGTGGIPDTSEPGDAFGYALTAGDYNGDGADDLAIGAPFENDGAGQVIVIYGSLFTGLGTGGMTSPQVWSHASSGVPAPSATGRFGISLASGNFNGMGPEDLAIGSDSASVGFAAGCGVVNVIYGTTGPTGLDLFGPSPAQVWHQDSPGIPDTAEPGDEFGRVLAAGDFDGNGATDLAVGIEQEDIGSTSGCGAVCVIYGLPGVGLTGSFSSAVEWWHQGRAGVGAGTEDYDQFGAALAVGDFNGDGVLDLAIGAPQETLTNQSLFAAGSVTILYGATGSGLTSDDALFLTRWTQGVTGKRYSHAWFGGALAAGNFDGSGGDDLAIGVPGDSVGNPAVAAGAINVVYGEVLVGLNPLGFPAAQLMHQNSTGMPEKAEDADSFGLSLGSR